MGYRLHVSFRDCGSFAGRFPGTLLCLLCLNTLNPVFVGMRERRNVTCRDDQKRSKGIEDRGRSEAKKNGSDLSIPSDLNQKIGCDPPPLQSLNLSCVLLAGISSGMSLRNFPRGYSRFLHFNWRCLHQLLQSTHVLHGIQGFSLQCDVIYMETASSSSIT